MNSNHNPVVVTINMKLKRTNATKRSEQLELNLLKEETYKNKYNVEVHNIYERVCIKETEQQPDYGAVYAWRLSRDFRTYEYRRNALIDFFANL